MLFQLIEADVAQSANAGKNRGKAADGFFAIRAAAIVFAGGELVLDHGVANHQLDGIGNQEGFKGQRAAIEHQRVVLYAVQGNELVHDADTSSDKFVFRFLAKLRQLDAVRRPAGLIGESQRGGDFNRGG